MFSELIYYQSPIGWLEIKADDYHLSRIRFIFINPRIECCPGVGSYLSYTSNNKNEIPKLADKCIFQLNEYFSGKRKEFDLDIKPKGTEYQIKVWNEVSKINFGQTASYKEIAERIGEPNTIRAVGNANSKNPIPIIIPCHRVIGANGNLTGYAGGLKNKKWLLDFEKRNINSHERIFNL